MLLIMAMCCGSWDIRLPEIVVEDAVLVDGFCVRSDLIPEYCWHCRGLEGVEVPNLD